MRLSKIILCSTVFSLAWTGLPARSADTANRAGVSAAVQGRVELSREEGKIVGRQVVGGEDIFLDDRLETGTDSGMQVLLLDETVFTIGPNSTLIIDEFVYDPNTGAGELSAEIVAGVFRFVTGLIAAKDPENMNVRLPVGTLGIRGTMVAGRVRPDGSSLVFLMGQGPNNDIDEAPGVFIASNAGVSETIRVPGWGVELTRGSPPTAIKLDPRIIEQITSELDNPRRVESPQFAKAQWWGPVAPSREAGRDTAQGRRFAQETERGAETSWLARDLSFRSITGALDQQAGLATKASLAAINAGTVFAFGADDMPPTLDDGGTYDFIYSLDFATQLLDVNFFNYNSPALGLVPPVPPVPPDGSSQIVPIYAPGSGDFAIYQLQDLVNSPGTACTPCNESITLLFFDAASPPQRTTHKVVLQTAGFPEVTGEGETSLDLSRPPLP